MRIMRKSANEGFTLVELMIVVAIVGVLAVLAVYGVRKYIANAKTAEARNALGQLAKDASTAYEKESLTGAGAVMAQGSSSTTLRALCTAASASIPSSSDSIKGKKYQSTAAEWSADSLTLGKGYACLKYSIDQPQYFMYTYTTSGSATQGDSFTAIANGDLSGDGVVSTFNISGAIGSGMVLNIAPSVAETNPEE